MFSYSVMFANSISTICAYKMCVSMQHNMEKLQKYTCARRNAEIYPDRKQSVNVFRDTSF